MRGNRLGQYGIDPDIERKLRLTRFYFEVWTKKRCEHFPCQLAIHIDHYSLMDNNSNI